MVTVIIHSPPQVGEPPRYLAIRKFPHMPRKPGWYVLGLVGLPSTSVCCLPRQRAQPPAPGEKFKTISRTAATTTGSGSWLTGWKGESQTRRELLRGAAVDWVLKVTTAIYGGRERGDFN